MREASAGRRAARITVTVLLAASVAFAGYQIWRRLEESYPLFRFEQSRESQRLINLWLYDTRQKGGFLLAPGDAQLAIRERFLQDVLSRSLPIREIFEQGRYVARLDRARLDLEDGLASITLLGNGRMLGPNASPLEADIELKTHIDLVEFRPTVGTMRAGLVITRAHVVRSGRGRGWVSPWINPVARYFAGLKVEDWNRERPNLEIPIRLKQEITLPSLQGDVSLPERRIPLAAHISAITVLQDRVVLSLNVEQGQGSRAVPAGTPRVELSPEIRRRAEKEVHRLYRGGRIRAEQDFLLRRVRDHAEHDSLWQAILRSDRDVVAIVPQPLLQTLCDRVAQSYLQGARLDFDPDLGVNLDQQIRARLVGKEVGAGRIFGRVQVTQLNGLLRASGNPKLTLLPPDGLELSTPVHVVEGRGRVKIDMRWDPSLLVSVVCRGFGFQEILDGEVVPFSHVLHTRIRFTPEESRITGHPVVRRDRISVPCEFTPKSLTKVREALREQDRFLRCGIAMDPDTVLARLRQLVRSNIRIRLPRSLFKPFSVPVSLEEEYEAGDFRISARAQDPEVEVRPEYLMFGFRAALRVLPPPLAASGDTLRTKVVPRGGPSGERGSRAGVSRE